MYCKDTSNNCVILKNSRVFVNEKNAHILTAKVITIRFTIVEKLVVITDVIIKLCYY